MAEGQQISGLEAEIAQIEQDLVTKRQALESQKQSGAITEVPHEKEILKEVIGEKISPQPVNGPVSDTQDQTPPVPLAPPTAAMPSYLSEDLKTQIQELINIAFSKSIGEAIGEVKKTNNPALIDAFHDALVDELFNHLVERGKLKKV